MKVGDLVRVKQTYGTPIVGIVVRLNNMGGALVQSLDSDGYKVWAYDWHTEVISESR